MSQAYVLSASFAPQSRWVGVLYPCNPPPLGVALVVAVVQVILDKHVLGQLGRVELAAAEDARRRRVHHGRRSGIIAVGRRVHGGGGTRMRWGVGRGGAGLQVAGAVRVWGWGWWCFVVEHNGLPARAELTSGPAETGPGCSRAGNLGTSQNCRRPNSVELRAGEAEACLMCRDACGWWGGIVGPRAEVQKRAPTLPCKLSTRLAATLLAISTSQKRGRLSSHSLPELSFTASKIADARHPLFARDAFRTNPD